MTDVSQGDGLLHDDHVDGAGAQGRGVRPDQEVRSTVQHSIALADRAVNPTGAAAEAVLVVDSRSDQAARCMILVIGKTGGRE